MPYEPFEQLCKYYIDYIIEDNTDNLSAFASGHRLSYMEVDNPELSSREITDLTNQEANRFNNLYTLQIAGRQNKSWWYGFPTIVKFVTAQGGWQGGFVKPLFVLNLDVNGGTPSLLPNIPRINNDAFRNLGLELEQIRSLADGLGLFSDEGYDSSLLELTEKLKAIFPDIQIAELTQPQSFANLEYTDDVRIYNKGIIFCTEASKITQGLEKELYRLKDSTTENIRSSSLVSFFPEIINKDVIPAPEFNLSEAIELNEQQRETVLSAFRNKLTVVTGPPGTGKSQVVASIVINAAKNGQRVLVASKNHKAVDVVEERLNQFAQRPFIIRLGRMGNDNRNIQQQLLQYLNSLLGIAPDNQINQRLLEIQNELTLLYNNRKSLIAQIEDYRSNRIKLALYANIWEETSTRIGSEKATRIFQKCNTGNYSLFDKIKLLFSKDWKNISIYTGLLKKSAEEIDLEALTVKLTQIELRIRSKSKEEFVLWLNNLPTRLTGERRRIIAEYVSVLQSIIATTADAPRNVWANLLRNRDRLMQELSGFLPAWCVTNLATRGQLPLMEGFFDLVVIDEASQCDISSAIPLLFRAKRAVIIGDPNQLTHISTLNTSRSLELLHSHGLTDTQFSVFEATTNSLFRLAASRIGDTRLIMLNEHFRSHEDIISYSNRTWYSGNLEIGTDYTRLNPTPGDNSTVEWIDVVGNIQQVDGSGAFISNEVNTVIQKVIELTQNPVNNYSIGVVTPFRLQANKIRQALVNQLPPQMWTRNDLLVDTAVKFQGDERDIMIFSPVVTPNMPRGIRYYHESEYNLLNVAITRARAKLIVIGNLNACLNCGISYIQNFAHYVTELDHRERGEGAAGAGAEFESPYEEILYNALLKRNIQTIPQYQCDQYRLDLAYFTNNKKIDIEIDGVQFHTEITGERIKQDIIRNRKLQKKGWTVLRFWSYEIRDNLDYCVSKILQEIKE